jgi:glycosyltransferase involved in cell wall biosynthesis
LFEAVRELASEIPELDRVLELNFVGVLQKEYHKLAKKIGIDHLVAEQGYVPHYESVAHLLASDVLWMTMSDDVSAPGKLYEYFGTHKPILGLVPKGSRTEKQLLEYGNAIVAEPNNVQEIKAAIQKYYNLWKNRALTTNANERFVKLFDRSHITKELAMQLTFMSGSLDGEIRKLRRKTV